MFKSILLITRRTLVKNKRYSLINIAGLTLGITSFVLISAYVNFEKSYDRFFKNADKIYRVESSFYRGSQLTDSWPTSTNGYATAMKANFPEIASIVRINWNNSERMVSYGPIKYREEHVCFADTNFFTFFSYPLLKGDPASVLREPNSMVISQSAAVKYFGNADPMGKVMDIDDKLHCRITGVFKNVPGNSTMKFNFLLSWATSPLWLRDFWYIHESYTFLTLKPGGDIHRVEAKFPALAEQYKTGPSFKDLKWAITLVPLTDIHLNPAKQYEIEAKGNRFAVNLLGLVAYIILLIAFVNYISLSTARAVDRAREVGIRKVNGASATQLLFQFLFESFVISSAALAISAALILPAAKLLPELLGNTFSFGLLFNTQLYIRICLVFILGVLGSAIYPAVLLSRLHPVSVLRGRYSFSKTSTVLRTGMAIFQFTASLLLIAGTLAVYRQMAFMGGQPLGINIDRTLVIKTPINTPGYAQKLQAFTQNVKGIAGVTGVTVSGAVPGKAVGEFLANRRFGSSKNEERAYEMLKVDYDFIKDYHLNVIAGHGFDRGRTADTSGVVLNEAAVQQFGFGSDDAAVGKQVWLETKEKSPSVVIGVVKNYHQQSLQEKYTPIVLFMDPLIKWIPVNYLSVKFDPARQEAIISPIAALWGRAFPESSFDWFFLGDFYNRQYQEDKQFGRLFLVFSALAIMIACMGLLGLTAYSTFRRTKEIGVRKVLGASARTIISMLTFETVRLTLYAGLLGLPLSYWFINGWLSGYAFRAPLTWWQFVLPVIGLILVSILTIAFITFRAAIANPVFALRDE